MINQSPHHILPAAAYLQLLPVTLPAETVGASPFLTCTQPPMSHHDTHWEDILSESSHSSRPPHATHVLWSLPALMDTQTSMTHWGYQLLIACLPPSFPEGGLLFAQKLQVSFSLAKQKMALLPGGWSTPLILEGLNPFQVYPGLSFLTYLASDLGHYTDFPFVLTILPRSPILYINIPCLTYCVVSIS